MTSNGKLQRIATIIGFLTTLTLVYVLVNRGRASIGWFSNGDWISLQSVVYVIFLGTITGTVIVLVKKYIMGSKSDEALLASEMKKTRLEMRKSRLANKGGKTNAKTTDKTPKSKKQRKR